MSWLLGRNRQQPQPDQTAGFSDGGGAADPEGRTAGEKSGDSQLSRAERKAMEAYRFDSSALERAADAAKTLERSSKNKISSANCITGMRHAITTCVCVRVHVHNPC